MRSLHRPRRWPTGILAAGAALALAASGCGTGSNSGGGGGTAENTPGVTADTVTIGSHQPLTGPAAPGYSEIAPAANALFRYINDNGGINGRKIKYIYKDDTYDPTRTVNVVKELVLQDKVFAIFNGLGTPTHAAVTDYLNQQKVPDLFVASGALQWDQPGTHPYTFGYQPDYVTEGKILGDHIKKTYPGKKVGYFVQGDDFGSDGMRGLDMYVDQSLVVAREKYTPGNTNIGPQIANLKAKGAEVVVCFCIPAYVALTILTKLKIGFAPQLVISNVGSDPTTLAGLLESFAKQGGASVQGNALLNGITSDGYLPATADTSNSWIQLFKKVHDKYIPALPFDGNVEYGMSAAFLFAQALQRAGKDLTRQGIVDAVNKGGFTGPGLVPYRFSATSHAGFGGAQIATLTNGVPTFQGTPVTTDSAGGPITPYTATQPQAPANGIPPA
jgi:ABC-type branched-subunit amino acid transport system substrate-binding protein